jgi:hypothetical protein
MRADCRPTRFDRDRLMRDPNRPSSLDRHRPTPIDPDRPMPIDHPKSSNRPTSTDRPKPADHSMHLIRPMTIDLHHPTSVHPPAPSGSFGGRHA